MSHFQLERIFKIHQRIRDEKYPHPDDLAEELDVSRRQIYEDRNFLIALGADIRFDRKRGKRGGWYYAVPWQLPMAIMRQGDLLAFFLSLEIVRRYQGTTLDGALRSTVESLTRLLNDSTLVDLHALSQCYSFTHPPSVAINESRLLDLYQATQQRQQVWVRYYWIERDQTIEGIVHPHHLHSFNDNWFLIAFSTATEAMETFSVGRIQAHRVLNDTFEPAADFDASAWVAATFQGEHGPQTVDVRIRFDAYQARFVREQAPKYPDQQIEELPDGGLILTIRTSGLGRLKRWVLSFGSRAEVLSPQFLREEVAAEVRRVMGLYGDCF